MADDVLVINHAQANLQVKERVNAKGAVTGYRTVISTTVTTEPITFMLDEGVVAQKAAEVLARTIREQTRTISEPVKPSTAKARRTAERAFSKGKPWALKRYSGGRTGVTPPDVGSHRMFNHSGRLADSIVARYAKQAKEWKINYAANRWNLADFDSQAHMQAAFRKWVDRVPVLKEPRNDLGIQRAIRDTFAETIQKQRLGTDYRAAELKGRAALERFRKLSEALSGGTSRRDEDEEEVA